MILGKSILAIIPARGGSKGIPRKNIRIVCGKPLIAWTIEQANKSNYIDRTIISTEDKEIIKVVKQIGGDIPFIRPLNLAHDDTPTVDVVYHVLDNLTETYDFVVLLQPTSPLRTVDDIDGGLEFFVKQNATTCVSVTHATKSPYWMYTLDTESRMKSLVPLNKDIHRRQDASDVYVLNGALYITKCKWFKKYRTFVTDETLAYIMKSENSIDVDSEMDLTIVETFIRSRMQAVDRNE